MIEKYNAEYREMNKRYEQLEIENVRLSALIKEDDGSFIKKLRRTLEEASIALEYYEKGAGSDRGEKARVMRAEIKTVLK